VLLFADRAGGTNIWHGTLTCMAESQDSTSTRDQTHKSGLLISSSCQRQY